MIATAGFARRSLYRFYLLVQGLLVPRLRNFQWAYREMLRLLIDPGRRWLDLGCGHQFLPEWMPGSEKEEIAILKKAQISVGIDADLPSLSKHRMLQDRVLGDIEQLPFRDHSFDLVTANMVVEHVQDPCGLLDEVSRILSPNGLFLFHTPNRYGYATLITDSASDGFKDQTAWLFEESRTRGRFHDFLPNEQSWGSEWQGRADLRFSNCC
jgi:ubiquinone/menaquinone biosynthesis C-methylase UbiE